MKFNFLCASALFLVFFICTGFIFSNHSNSDFEKKNQSQNNFSLSDSSNKDTVYTTVEQYPKYDDGNTEFISYVIDNLNYPSSAKEKGIEGQVVVVFVIDKDGSVIDAKVVKSVDTEIDAEALRVIQNSPKWTPAVHKGENVKVRRTVPINFNLRTTLDNDVKEDISSVFTIVEAPAIYRGGMDAFYEYIRQNLKYPKSALENEIEGQVVVQFVINQEGYVKNIAISKSLSADCDEEAIRLLEECKRWSPAIYRGDKVEAEKNVTITFELNKRELRKYKKAKKKAEKEKS